LKSVSEICYIGSDAGIGRVTPVFGSTLGTSRGLRMTIELIHLTAQIQRWLNFRIARHLAAQAEKLEPTKH
jgi:hypothetical protein